MDKHITIDGNRLADDFRKLGKHISDASGSYNDTEKRLGLMLDRVGNIIKLDGKEDEVNKKLLS